MKTKFDMIEINMDQGSDFEPNHSGNRPCLSIFISEILFGFILMLVQWNKPNNKCCMQIVWFFMHYRDMKSLLNEEESNGMTLHDTDFYKSIKNEIRGFKMALCAK